MPRDARPFTDAERLDWLRLARSENVGPATFFALLAHCGDVAEAIARAPELSLRGGRSRAIKIASRDEVAREAETLAADGGHLIVWGEAAYPEPLAAIHDPPPVISVKGDPKHLSGRCVAVVGARNASAAGRRFARDIAAGLGHGGLTVVSGLARGIDTAAHEGALATGTVAVVAGGVDDIYPSENAALYARIVAEGAVISEQPFGTQPTARHFPRRNRLISGLSLGTLVVEAAERSGSLITARMALEQGREVFAVPGSPLDPRCKGTNGLIRAGATLTEGAQDVVEALSGMLRTSLAEPFSRPPGSGTNRWNVEEKSLPQVRPKVLEALGPTPVTVDDLIRECQLSAAVVLTVLLELELAGRVERHPGSRFSLSA